MSRAGLRALTILSAFALVATACQDDRATVTDPVGTVYNARFSRVASNLPRGTVQRSITAAAQGSRFIQINIAGLESLETGAYAVWLGRQTEANAEPVDVVPAAGRLRIIHTDTTFTPEGDPVPVPDTTTVTGGYSWTVGGARTRIELRVDSASLFASGAANTNPANYNLVFVTIEPGAAGAAPTAGAPHPLWARFFGVSTNTTANLSFGNFDPDPAQQYVFNATGRGMIGVWNNILVVDDSSLALPPEGYYYATVLTRVTDAASTALEFIDLGPQKAPYPRRNVSLYDADINQTLDPAITLFPPSILAASERVQIDTIAGASLSTDQPFRLYREVRVTLEAKQGIDLPSSTVIIAATFPEPSVKPPED